MNNDIKNQIRLSQYPKLEKFENITKDELLKFIENNKCFRQKYLNDLDYYVGKNVTINKKNNTDKNNPDSRISIPYARTMSQIVKGYMYKPGLITYQSKNEKYIEQLQEIFNENNEELKTSELGENQSKYGLGVELLYTDEMKNQEGQEKIIPRFTPIKPEECIFIFNMEIEPKLIGTIRYYIVEEDKELDKRIWRVEIYYLDRVEIYKMIEKISQKETPILQETFPNNLGEIPFILYLNNQEYHADYQPVQTLVDSYDLLMSDAINETNRFANAYMILKNYIFANSEDENEKRRKLENIKSKRLIELIDNGEVSFLTKEIPSEFIDMLKNTLREDIEYHSHIPDFRSKNFEAKSGIAMMWALFDFENLAGDKQALFEQGLQRRIELINKFLNIKAVETDKVHINFERNTPIDNTVIINEIVQLKASGIVADQILIERLQKLGIIDDVDQAMQLLDEQKEKNMEMMPMNIDEEKSLEKEKKKNDKI